MHIVIEVKHLLWKRRIIGKDSRWIGIYMDSRENGFHCYGLIPVSKDPVELGQGILTQAELLSHRLPEMPASLVPVIEEIWLNEVVGK